MANLVRKCKNNNTDDKTDSDEIENGTHIDDREDVLEGHVGEEHENGTVDVHDPVLIEVLTEEDHSDQYRHHLKTSPLTLNNAVCGNIGNIKKKSELCV